MIWIQGKKIEKNEKEVFSYSIKIADFYYKDTAKLMLIELKMKHRLKIQKLLDYQKQNIGYY